MVGEITGLGFQDVPQPRQAADDLIALLENVRAAGHPALVRPHEEMVYGPTPEARVGLAPIGVRPCSRVGEEAALLQAAKSANGYGAIETLATAISNLQ